MYRKCLQCSVEVVDHFRVTDAVAVEPRCGRPGAGGRAAVAGKMHTLHTSGRHYKRVCKSRPSGGRQTTDNVHVTICQNSDRRIEVYSSIVVR